MMNQDRKSTLLRAAYDLLIQQDESIEAVNLLGECVSYDGDNGKTGYCLMDDIAEELGLAGAAPAHPGEGGKP